MQNSIIQNIIADIKYQLLLIYYAIKSKLYALTIMLGKKKIVALNPKKLK
jgi:hypothetical protein